MLSDDERTLLAQFLAAVDKSDDSPETISARIGGKPSGPTIRRYQRGDFPKGRIDPESRRGMEWLLTGHSAAAKESLPYDLEREAADLARASAIEDPVMRMVERESILAVIRTQAVREAAWAARIEAQNAAARSDARIKRQTAPVTLGTARKRQKGRDVA